MKVLEAIDSFFASLWHWPLMLLCGISGRSNIFWSRAAFACAVMWLGANMALNPVSQSLPARIALDALIVVACMINMIMFWSWTQSLETDSQNQDEIATLQEVPLVVLGLRLTLNIAMIFGMGKLFLYGGPHRLIGLVAPAAFYWATDHRPPGKSWLRRHAEFLKNTLFKALQPRLPWAPQGTG